MVTGPHDDFHPQPRWTILKLTCRMCGTNPSTLARGGARVHQIGEPNWSTADRARAGSPHRESERLKEYACVFVCERGWGRVCVCERVCVCVCLCVRGGGREVRAQGSGFRVSAPHHAAFTSAAHSDSAPSHRPPQHAAAPPLLVIAEHLFRV